MEEDLIALLLADGAVQAMAADRIWPLVAPQKSARPYVVVQKVSSVTDYTTVGASGFCQARSQIDVYADTYAQGKSLMRRVCSALSGRRGGIFKGIFAQSERDLTDQNSVMSSPDRVYRISQDFMIHHTGDVHV